MILGKSGTSARASTLLQQTARCAHAVVCAAALSLAGCGRADQVATGEPQAETAQVDGIALSAAVVQKLGVRTAAVEFSPLPNETRAPGIIRYDERSIVDVLVPIAGWVERPSVRALGERVHPAQLLFELYSPVLVTTDAQYLRSLESGSDPVDNPYARGLLALGLSEDMISALRDKRRKVGRIPFRAHDEAIVTALNFRQGAFVAQGVNVMQLTAADPVWAIVEVPETDAAGVRAGMAASVTAPAYPGWKHDGKISYVYPQLDPATRSVQARIVLPSRNPPLLPGMFVSVALHGVAGDPTAHVPSDAVIRGARGDRVIVASGEGRFVPRSVQTGRASGDRIAILSGLRSGEQVVTRATFLIDSEASLQSSLGRMDARESDGKAAPDPHARHH